MLHLPGWELRFYVWWSIVLRGRHFRLEHWISKQLFQHVSRCDILRLSHWKLGNRYVIELSLTSGNNGIALPVFVALAENLILQSTILILTHFLHLSRKRAGFLEHISGRLIVRSASFVGYFKRHRFLKNGKPAQMILSLLVEIVMPLISLLPTCFLFSVQRCRKL